MDDMVKKLDKISLWRRKSQMFIWRPKETKTDCLQHTVFPVLHMFTTKL